jgi:very-short-patch-repair endonuclease
MNQFAALINDRIEAMRRKLQDTSRRNPLINNVLSAKTASFVRIVDEKPQSIFDYLVTNERSMTLVPLPPIDIDPPDENTTEFKNAFLNAQSTDEIYLKAVEQIDFEYDEKALDKQENADRLLKDRLRSLLEMPPRPSSGQHFDLVNHAKSHGINPSNSLPLQSAASADDRFDDDELQTLLLPKTFYSRLSSILSKARMYQEERGLDVVYIALGYLKWTLPNSEKQDDFKSPILLLPVTLTKQKSVNGESYTIAKSSDPLLNPSLDHKLTVEAKLDLSDVRRFFDLENIDVEELFETVANIRPKNMQWSVLREASFGIYPFQGIELYYDLETKSCDFSSFPIVSELMVGKDSSSAEPAADFTEADVDSAVGKRLVPHIVLDADSSQFISLLKVANNENVALEGPPGSGKSQTIVNAIANAIYSGKKVLFVAQKVTALEVVLSRLQSLGIHQFVLPLMGGHGNTDEFYQAIEDRLSMKSSTPSRELQNLKAQYEANRDKLSAYIDVLTGPVKGTGMSVHQVLGLSISNAEIIKNLPLELRSIRVSPAKLVEDFGPLDIDAMAAQVADWCLRLANNKIPTSSPWSDAPAETFDTNLVNKALVDAGRSSLEIETALSRLDAAAIGLISEFLNNPLKIIEYRVNELSCDIEYIRAYELSIKIGKDEADKALGDLIQVGEKLSALKKELGLPLEKLSLVVENKGKFLKLNEFVTEHRIKKIEVGVAASTLADLVSQKGELMSLSQIKLELMNDVSPSISIRQILSYSSFSNDLDDLRHLKRYIVEVGSEVARSELRKGRKHLRLKSEIFTVSEMPSIREIKNLRNTIKSAGVLSFLSSEYTFAKKNVCRILRTSDSRVLMLGKLEEAIDFLEEWEKLELSNHVDISDDALPDYLDRLQIILENMEAINSRTQLDFARSLPLVFFDKFDALLVSLGNFNRSDFSWQEVELEYANIEERIAKLRKSLKEISAAESVFSSFGFVSPIKLSVFISNCDIIATTLDERNTLISRLSLDFEDDLLSKKIFDALRSICEMPESTVKLLFGSDSKQALGVLKGLLPAYSASHASFSTLMSLKNQQFEWVSMSEVLEVLAKHRNDHSGLSNLLARRAVFSEAENAGLENVIIKMEKAGISQDFYSIGKAALAASLKDQIQYEFGSVLMQYDGAALNAARKRIQEIDRKIVEISRHEVSNNAISFSKPPQGVSYGKKSDYTELGLLKHQLNLKRRTPPRKILKRAHNALMELFPCYMMVPTAVAQHLPKRADFDLVIIDEASQMTPENSISALMRARNAFIAGDTNQLPPTNFFKGLSVDEEEDEDVTTTEESILELANVQFHPKHRLLWHYRSKHEDLIAFSNHYVYDSELVIFPSPSPTTKGMGVSLIEVNGTFQRGVNPAEAQVMLEAIVQFMKDTPNRSLGVAVMNQSQMEQIEALVLREAETNKVVSKYLDDWASARQGLEKFFVKNLENIQGDERDVIFVGTVYGRDPQGKFYQRFGPINGPAGKRRLNVLFSRAKEQMVTFSSIPLGEFNPSPTNEGATLLRRWLEFSATKRLGEVPHNHDRAGHTDSPFEDHVIEAVRSLGYEAVPQVGVSSYFIDIGVKHPSYPLGYICGIECDGATYHSSKSARDRDRLREEVLNRLGWGLYRIWSTDWFRDPLGCREVLKSYLAERLQQLLNALPKIVQPKLPEVKMIEPSVLKMVENIRSERNAITANIGSTATATITDSAEVKVGSRVSFRYLNGPRAGSMFTFRFKKTSDLQNIGIDGLKSIGPDKPLGEAIEGTKIGDIVSFAVDNNEMRVEVIDVKID